MINNKLIAARKERNKTQKDMADLLCISQSQYQRREKGEINILDDQWVRMAKFLEKEVEDIREENAEYAANHYSDNASENYADNRNIYCSIPQYLLDNQQEYIKLLKQKISDLEKKTNQSLLPEAE
jgi:transcriptional regulator with XRE-family HTH domain